MKAISIDPPWAWLIVHGYKDVENRSWPTKHRGKILIHATNRRVDEGAYRHFEAVCQKAGIKTYPAIDGFKTGGIVGSAEIFDCVRRSDSIWYKKGQFGFILKNAKPTAFKRISGRQKIWNVPPAGNSKSKKASGSRAATKLKLKIKSVDEPISKRDGIRILAARYRRRYMPASMYDVWMPSLGPSEKLFKTGDGAKTDREWDKRFRDQMLGKDGKEPKNPFCRNSGQKYTLRLIKHIAKTRTVTLMCHCKNENECHRTLLRDLILSDKI